MISIAVSGRRAAGVARLVAHQAPTVFRVIGDGADEISAVATDGVDAVLAQVNHDLGFSGALRLARSLRTSRFFRGAIFLLVPDAAANEDGELRERFREQARGVHLYDTEWNIYADRLPPRDIAVLQEFLEANLAMGPEEWRRMCMIGISELCDELVRLSLWLTPDTLVNEPELREAIEYASRELRAAHGNHSPMKEMMQRMLLAPELSDQECSQLLKMVSAAEAQVPKTDQSLHSALHKLKNDLILPRKDEVKVQGNIRCLRQRATALVRIADDWPELVGVARRIRDVLDGDVRSLPDALSELQRWSLANAPNRTDSARLCSIERILVVDDHATWRQRLAEVAKRLEPGIEVETAADVESAVKILSNDKPTLAIVDLELPHTYGEVPDPEGGLRLVQAFKKKRLRKSQEGQKEEIAQYPHRFLILTASGNYEEAVRESLRLNISAARFMIKEPEVWSGDLPAQIRLALQPPLKTYPKIDVFPRTGRVARLDGVEIILERQAWCFLSALATRPRRFVSSEELARMLCHEPYWLDPKSKSPATKEFSEEQMLMKQFKDYESDLGLALDHAYRLVHGMPPVDPIVERCEDESVFYRLNATVTQMKHYAYSMLEEDVKVLVVEDDSRWRDSIAKELKACGFQVVLARHVEEACSMVVRENPDLISLDLELPADQTALETGSADISNTLGLFQFVRDHAPDLPVAVMTASEWTDEIMLPLLREGVRIEDYISKGEAGALRRLAASLHRLWREMTSKSRILDSDANFNKLPLHPIRIDPQTKMLSHVGGCAIEVRADRAKLLKILSETPNLFVSRMELIRELYPASEWEDKNLDQSLNNTVSRLRKDIKAQTGIEGSEIVVDEMKAYMLRGQPIQNI